MQIALLRGSAGSYPGEYFERDWASNHHTGNVFGLRTIPASVLSQPNPRDWSAAKTYPDEANRMTLSWDARLCIIVSAGSHFVWSRVSGLPNCVKEGVEFEITVQESRGFRVRALQGRVLAEKTLGPLLFDHLPSAFGLPQEAYQTLHSASRPGNRIMSVFVPA